jgi:hypothetical protein
VISARAGLLQEFPALQDLVGLDGHVQEGQELDIRHQVVLAGGELDHDELAPAGPACESEVGAIAVEDDGINTFSAVHDVEGAAAAMQLVVAGIAEQAIVAASW